MNDFLIEAAVIAHLMSELQTEHVYAERPKNPPEEYYIVERTSSGETNHIQTATIAVQSYGGSMLRAAEMCADVRRVMPLIVQTTDNVSCCRLNSAYNYTDEETRQYRYQAVFDLYYMEGE